MPEVLLTRLPDVRNPRRHLLLPDAKARPASAPRPVLPAHRLVTACPVCGGTEARRLAPVLWPGLIEEWGLSTEQAAQVDRREGEFCPGCDVRLRSAALAAAMLRHMGTAATLEAWVASRPALRILEVNLAGQLTPWLRRLPGHRLVEHPEVDLQALPFPDGAWDLVLHSDTLEHVPDPRRALSECRRVLVPGGALCFTVPVLDDRLTRSRDGLPASYHGLESDPAYLVMTEYGADFWVDVLAVGFRSLEMVALSWPAAVAFVATG